MGANVIARRVRSVGVTLALLVVVIPTISERPAAGLPPTVTCDTDPDIFNTGYDAATGTVLAAGKQDANWEVAGRFPKTSPRGATSLPPSDAVWGPANVVGRLSGNWSASPYGNAEWISQETLSARTSQGGDWYYRYRFTLDPGVDPAEFSLSMSFLADNAVSEVYVNDVAQSPQTTGLPQHPASADPYYLYGFHIRNASKTVLNRNWRAGENTLIVHIKSEASYEGFLAQMRPSRLCPRAEIQVKKTAVPTILWAPGDKVNYKFDVTNFGNQPLTDVTVTEAAFSGQGAAPTVSCPKSALDPEEIMTCTAQYTVTQADYDAAKATGTYDIANTATASGTPPAGAAVTSQPSSTKVSVRQPGLFVVKATTKPFVTEVGEQVPYTFTLTSTATYTLTKVTVTDAKVGMVTCPGNNLAGGQTMQCTATYTTTQADLDAGQITNQATAGGVAVKPLSGVSNEVVVPALYHPALNIVKATAVTDFDAVGVEIPYTFTVTNIGNVTLHGLTVSDPKVADPTCPLAVLKPGEGTVCGGSYTTTQADVDAGHVVNDAVATARTPADVEVRAPSNRQVVTGNPRPQLTIVKSTPATFYDRVGQKISFTLTVTNTGNQNVRDITVTDRLLGGTVCTISPLLAPGEQQPCTVTYTTTAGDLDAGRLTNQAAVAGMDPANHPVTAVSNRVVVPAVHSPQLTLVKNSATTEVGAGGGTIPYEFSVVNTGNVAVDNVKVSDPRTAGVACPATKLAAGARMTCHATYTVTPADLDAGQVVNRATVGGDVPSSGRKLEPTSSNEVIIRTAAASDGPEVFGATQPGTAAPVGGPTPAAQLPRTGGDIRAVVLAGLGLAVLGRWLSGGRPGR